MNIIRRIFDYRGAPLLAAMFMVLFITERKNELRKRTQSRTRRYVINTMLALPAFTLLRLLLIPAMVKLAASGDRRNLGLAHKFPKWPLAGQFLSFFILDYTNYLWHVLNHRIPALWRFHVVHHADPDLDLSTAVRFHFGEIIGSVIFRGSSVLLAGAKPATVLYYEILFEAATQFHHSNLKLPIGAERLLNKVIVTPRMHGIHHSVIRRETDSNYSVIFSFWDRIHNTVRLNVQQDKIVTGVPSYSDPDELTIGFLLLLPFRRIRPWTKTDHKEEDRITGTNKGRLAR